METTTTYPQPGKWCCAACGARAMQIAPHAGFRPDCDHSDRRGGFLVWKDGAPRPVLRAVYNRPATLFTRPVRVSRA